MKACVECKHEYPDCLVASMVIESGSTLEAVCPLCAYANHINPARGLPPETPPLAGERQALAMFLAAKAIRTGELSGDFDSVEVIVKREAKADEPADDPDYSVLSQAEVKSFVDALEVLTKLKAVRSEVQSGIIIDFARTCLSHETLRAENTHLRQELMDAVKRGGAEAAWALKVVTRAAAGVEAELHTSPASKANGVPKH